jgi:hypothetical protein
MAVAALFGEIQKSLQLARFVGRDEFVQGILGRLGRIFAQQIIVSCRCGRHRCDLDPVQQIMTIELRDGEDA